MKFNTISLRNIEMWSSQVAHQIEWRINKTLLTQDTITIALSGGSSPIPFFKELNSKHLPWSRIIWTMVDERITEDREQLNSSLIKEYLFANIDPKRINFIDYVDLSKSPEEMEKDINAMHLKIDLCVLGMGDDGHTASIFKDSESYGETLTTKKQFTLSMASPKCNIEKRRLTLSYSGIMNATEVFLTFGGLAKNKIFELEYEKYKSGKNLIEPAFLVVKNHAKSSLIFY